MPRVAILAYGSLRRELNGASSVLRDLPVQEALPVPELLRELNIPLARVQLVMRNNRAVKMDACVRPGDRVALFPREYPVFADWKDYRPA